MKLVKIGLVSRLLELDFPISLTLEQAQEKSEEWLSSFQEKLDKHVQQDREVREFKIDFFFQDTQVFINVLYLESFNKLTSSNCVILAIYSL